MISKQTIEHTIASVTNRMMNLKNDGLQEKFPVSLVDIDCWEWPQGVGIYGLYQQYKRSQDPEILSFLVAWYDRHLQEMKIEKNVNTTAPMLTLTYLYEITKNKSYYNLIEEWAMWVMDPSGLLRTPDGCFQHMITGDANDDEILIDTLFMTLLFLIRAGTLLDRQEYIDEANFQLLNHIKYLFDKQNNLFYHGFNFKRNDNYGAVHWARGNAWYTIGAMIFLELQPNMNPAVKKYFTHVFSQQVIALKECVHEPDALWHTVLDDDTSYLEMSASAGFLCGMMKGVRAGILSHEIYFPIIQKGVSGILKYIDPDGSVTQVSYGTPIGESVDFYKNIICCTMTYGQALTILLLEEALDPYWLC